MKHGGYANPDRPDLDAAVHAIFDEAVQQLGGLAEQTPTRLRVIQSFARAAVLEESAFSAMVEAGGPITGKGSKRAIFDVWDRLDEKLNRRAERLGFERKARPANSLQDVLQGRAD